MVRHFLEFARALQAQGDSLYCYRPGAALIPASFKVAEDGQSLIPDYGGHAIGRVAPVDSSLWWLYLLRVYTRATGAWDLAQREDPQVAIQRVLDLCLPGRFDMYPTLLVPDGSFMVDRRMGVYGYPLEVQVLFLMALRSADELLAEAGEVPFTGRRCRTVSASWSTSAAPITGWTCPPSTGCIGPEPRSTAWTP